MAFFMRLNNLSRVQQYDDVMNTRIIAALGIGVFLNVASGYGQAGRRGPVDRHPCPGGTGAGILETISPDSLEQLVRISDLIVVGTVARVLPSTLIDPNNPSLPETTSLIDVNEVVWGALPYGTNTISISELGGRVGPCGLVISGNPLVKDGEEYVFFLFADKRNVPPNTSGSPRYTTVGAWSGKAKISDGKIHFLPPASQGLHRYDSSTTTAFVATVKATVSSLRKGRP